MTDLLFLAITLASFALMAMLVGVIERRLDEHPASDERTRV